MKLFSEIKAHIAIAMVVLWIGIGTVAYQRLENWTLIQSLYFSVSTLSTVGYGDLVPTTDISRLFTSFYILFGVAVVLTALGRMGGAYLRRMKRKSNVEIKELVEEKVNEKKDLRKRNKK